VFENLFRNAVEHGGSDVTVTIRTIEPIHTSTRADADRRAGFYVADDGPGIPVEKRDEVFEPGHSSAQGGTGFGLTIVKRIVQAHGWELSVADGTDSGARFEFEMSEQGEFV
jgi:signal transduction histidine kinase